MVTGRFTDGRPDHFAELARLGREKAAALNQTTRLQDDETGVVPLSLQFGR